MEKFNLQKLLSLVVASVLSVNLAGCSFKEMKAADKEGVILEENNGEEINGALYPMDMFDISLVDVSKPVAVPIEEVVMEDGTICYKYPTGYIPFLVDETKPMPGEFSVLEKNEEFEIVSGDCVQNLDGIGENVDFSGAVAVYYPYYTLISYKYNTVLNPKTSLSCDLIPIQSDVFPEAYFLPDGYKLYSPNVENENLAIGYETIDQGTVYGMSSVEAAHNVGVRDDVYLKLLDIDKYEVTVRAVYFEQKFNNER